MWVSCLLTVLTHTPLAPHMSSWTPTQAPRVAINVNISAQWHYLLLELQCAPQLLLQQSSAPTVCGAGYSMLQQIQEAALASDEPMSPPRARKVSEAHWHLHPTPPSSDKSGAHCRLLSEL